MRTQILLALRILRRRKFFTFISLFGISFTIMALVVVAAMGEASLGDNPPFGNRDRLVIASHYRAEHVIPDTSYVIDSALVGGVMTYDSTLQVGEDTDQDNNSGLGYYLYDNFLRDLDGAERVSYAAPSANFNVYLDGRKVELAANYTDAAYFEILDFEWVAGGAYTPTQVAEAERVAVLSDEAAREYYGRASVDLLGESMPIGEKDYRIVGIVRRPATRAGGVGSDVFLPITTAGPDYIADVNHNGGGLLLATAPTPGGRDRIKTSLAAVAADLQPTPDDTDKNRFYLEGLTFAEEIANYYYRGEGKNRDRAFGKFFGPVLVLLLMLVLLPALNLANVNLSRVFERAPEIAVRKSFGATDADILRQFLLETLVITVIGGALGVLLSLGVIALANAGEWIGGMRLAFTPAVAGYTLLIIVVFGLITGLAPAYRLAQTRIATSLR